MKTSIVIFCYRGEEEVLPLQVAHLSQVLPQSRVHLVDDAGDPLPPALVEQLKGLHQGVSYQQSDFDRKKNLNGEAAIRGIVSTMTDLALRDDADVVIKLDPDTLILRAEVLLSAFLQGGCTWFAATSQHGLYSGMCYMMTRLTLERVNAVAQRLPWHIFTQEDKLPEDVSIMSLCNFVAAGKAHYHLNLNDPNVSPHVGAFDTLSVNDPARYAEALAAASKATLITLGNTGVCGQPRAYRVKIMHDVLRSFNQAKTNRS